jgi:endonuclease YncB( thermonuclease family)
MSDMPDRLWVYRASWERVVDGDTIDIRVDQGFRNFRRERLRLLGVNAPEMRGVTRDAGLAARTFVEEWLQEAELATPDDYWPLVIETAKSDAFGRFLSMVWRIWDGACLNDALIEAGHAMIDIR